MLTPRQGLWLLAVMFTPLTIAGAFIAVQEGDAFIWQLIFGCAVIAVIAVTWLVRDLLRDKRG